MNRNARLNLTPAQRYKLTALVEREFVDLKMSRSGFAIYAGKTLEFPVTQEHVRNAMEAVGIEPTTPRKPRAVEAPELQNLIDTVAFLKSTVQQLTNNHQTLSVQMADLRQKYAAMTTGRAAVPMQERKPGGLVGSVNGHA